MCYYIGIGDNCSKNYQVQLENVQFRMEMVKILQCALLQEQFRLALS